MIVGLRFIHTSRNGIIAYPKEEYAQDYSPPGGLCVYHHASWYTGGIHAQISKSTLRR